MAYTIQIEKTKKSRLGEIELDKAPFGRVFTDHMFLADYSNGAWHDFRVVPTQELSFHPANMTLHYGQAIFEGMKAFKDHLGHPVLFRPEKNAERLNFSARRMSMAELPVELFLEGLEALIELDADWIPQGPDSSLYIRPFMIANDSFIGVAASESYRFIILLLPVGPYYTTPVNLWVERNFVRAAVGGTGEAKAAGNYAASLYPAKMARQKGYDQILWLDANEHRWIEESGTMNVFFVIDDLVVTPALGGSILRGITRDSCITLLKDHGIEVQERPISIDEIQEAYRQGILREAFGVGTAVVVIPFKSIADGDTDMVLDPASYRIAPMLRNEINGIRKGLLPDKHHWVRRVGQQQAILAH
jgi:branched-chain amino acid aminotransferase